jgi:hypothetical protein
VSEVGVYTVKNGKINPAYRYVCGPHVQPKPKPPATWTGIIKGQAGGPLIQWGPHGIVVGPPPKPERRLTAAVIDGLLVLLSELKKEKVRSVYLPYANEPLSIVGSISYRSLQQPDLKIGGEAMGRSGR